MYQNLLKTLYLLAFIIISNITFSQSIVFGHIIKENQHDTINGNLTVYRQINDTTFVIKEKKFRNESMISLDPGKYIFVYQFLDQEFIENITIGDSESVIIFNIFEAPQSISEFDFSKVIYVTPGMVELSIRRRKDIYIEF